MFDPINSEPQQPHSQTSKRRAAVIGSPIDHSLSPLLHNTGYKAAGLDNWEFTRFEVKEAEVANFLAQASEEFVGFACTMPCKFEAFAQAVTRSERAQALQVANTLVRRPNGWFADNTDVDGVRGALDTLLGSAESLEGKDVLVTGAGGTARTVVWTLAHLKVASITVVNRSDRLHELQGLTAGTDAQLRYLPATDEPAALDAVAAAASNASVVVSTVPSAGIAALVDHLAQAPVFDVIYDPWPTPLVQRATKRGLPAVGGHVMLAHQAYTQFEAFTGTPAPREQMWAALSARLGIAP